VAAVEIRVLTADDRAVLANVAPDVFDEAIDPRLAAEFLADPRHHLAVAIDGGQVVGFASGVHYVHPDKPAEMWINEVGVADSHQRRGLGQAVVRALLEHATRLGCREAWVLTDDTNAAAKKLYASCGGTAGAVPSVMFTFVLDA
jgi:ribosomal protein S18 acetylase RimI-like enzyme